MWVVVVVLPFPSPRLPFVFSFLSDAPMNTGLDEFGIDPSLEPELAMALRISMEEERARVRAAQAGAGGSGADAPSAAVACSGAAAMDTGIDHGECGEGWWWCIEF